MRHRGYCTEYRPATRTHQPVPMHGPQGRGKWLIEVEVVTDLGGVSPAGVVPQGGRRSAAV